MMKIHILTLFLLAFLLLPSTHSCKCCQDDPCDQDDNITQLTFFVQYQPEDDHDFIQIGLTIQARDKSLKRAIKKVQDIAENIEDLTQSFCEENPVNGINCDDIVDVEDFEIQAEYTIKRKNQDFQEFVVTQRIEIDVYQTDKIGELADSLLETQVQKINYFDWESTQEDQSEQQAIQAGKQKSQEMCYHLGMKLHQIVSIEAIEDEDDDDQDQEEEFDDDDQEDYQEDDLIVYKFRIQCIQDSETLQRKQKEQEEEDKEQAEEKEEERKKKEEEEAEEERRKAAAKQKTEKPGPTPADKKKVKK